MSSVATAQAIDPSRPGGVAGARRAAIILDIDSAPDLAKAADVVPDLEKEAKRGVKTIIQSSGYRRAELKRSFEPIPWASYVGKTFTERQTHDDPRFVETTWYTDETAYSLVQTAEYYFPSDSYAADISSNMYFTARRTHLEMLNRRLDNCNAPKSADDQYVIRINISSLLVTFRRRPDKLSPTEFLPTLLYEVDRQFFSKPSVVTYIHWNEGSRAGAGALNFSLPSPHTLRDLGHDAAADLCCI